MVEKSNFAAASGADPQTDTDQGLVIVGKAAVSLQIVALAAAIFSAAAYGWINDPGFLPIQLFIIVLLALSGALTAFSVWADTGSGTSDANAGAAASLNRRVSAIESIAAGLDSILSKTLEVVQTSLTVNARQQDLIGKSGSESAEDMAELAKENASIKELANQLKAKLQSAKSETERLQGELEKVTAENYTDGLSRLKNRKWFDKRIKQEIEAAEKKNTPFSLALLDLDKFKNINDKFGHPTGDRIIKWVGERLIENVKGRDSAARYGGEEFAIMLPDTTLNDAKSVLEKIRKKFESVNWTHAQSGRTIGQVTVSVGIAEFKSGETEESLLSRADKNLYEAKVKGRNQVIAK
ncbi:MAG: diguanylate cyclase [Filomicrobium sp.]